MYNNGCYDWDRIYFIKLLTVLQLFVYLYYLLLYYFSF